MENWHIIVGLILIFVIGFVKILVVLKNTKNDYDFVSDFRNNFFEFSNKYFNGSLDNKLYITLTKDVSEIQRTLGYFGIVHRTEHRQTYIVPQYEVLLNSLPKFRDGTIKSDDAYLTEDCLIRYLGYTEKRIKGIRETLFNPIIWFKMGIQQIVSIPLYFFYWFGILGKDLLFKISNNKVFKIFSGIIALIAFIDFIAKIITGEELIVRFIRDVFFN